VRSPPQVTIGVPCYDDWKTGMAVSLIRALVTDFPYGLHLSVQRGTYIAEGREMCVKYALDAGSDFLVFVDTDITFPADAIRRLIELDKDIVGGNYHEKRLPLTSTVKLPDFTGQHVFYQGDAVLPDQPFKAAAVATGFMAINLRRLTACMSAPYFALDPQGRPWRPGHGSLDGPGEDIAFAIRAQQAGLEVWCHPGIKLGHLGEFEY
jgi:hypothetical protein